MILLQRMLNKACYFFVTTTLTTLKLRINLFSNFFNFLLAIELNLVNMITRFWYLPVHSSKTPLTQYFRVSSICQRCHDCERDRLYSMTRNSHIVRDGFLPLPSLSQDDP